MTMVTTLILDQRSHGDQRWWRRRQLRWGQTRCETTLVRNKTFWWRPTHCCEPPLAAPLTCFWPRLLLQRPSLSSDNTSPPRCMYDVIHHQR